MGRVDDSRVWAFARTMPQNVRVETYGASTSTGCHHGLDQRGFEIMDYCSR
jgi:hypothetical protein